jgi:GNAT superfamily N-acetyltransferase
MNVVSINKASQKGIRALSRKLLKLLEDKDGQIYQDNVAKFGIPEEYVRKAFSEEALLEAAKAEKSNFYLALENKCNILGFAQTVQKDAKTIELDRIVVFPERIRQGIGTKLLGKVIRDEKRRETKTIAVNAGVGETHARRFYEKNGFKPVKEAVVEAPWGRIVLVTYELQL